MQKALLSAQQKSSKDWKLKMAVNHLMQNLNSPSVDFLSTYLTLPILNGKSLSDIKNTECSDGLKQKYEDKKKKKFISNITCHLCI
ncbi:uncharacterized protein CG3556 [Caerostris extrusa]|uniref:Uncharacterized protein CG3556 n=1 Tax=Caerostris extrusa TaxID=172846 RepID=A0AAV4QWE9_CAEEX|nr:uncharacterized protein CG3556 [Caerostris extrusa]